MLGSGETGDAYLPRGSPRVPDVQLGQASGTTLTFPWWAVPSSTTMEPRTDTSCTTTLQAVPAHTPDARRTGVG
jgi:hypothetical protein